MGETWSPLEPKENVYNFSSDGLTLGYKYIENKKTEETLLLFYGFGGNSEMTGMITPFLKDKYSILVVDYPGHSYSPTSEDNSVDTYIKIILKLLRHLKKQKINIIGYSFGGVVALRFYELYAENIKKIVFFNTKPFFTNTFVYKILYKIIELMLSVSTYHTITKMAIPILKDRFFTKEHYALAKEVSLYNESRSVVKNYREVIYFNAKRFLKLIKCPALIVYSGKDFLVSKSDAKKMSDEIKGSKVIGFKNYGHLALVTGPQEISKEILSFFER